MRLTSTITIVLLILAMFAVCLPVAADQVVLAGELPTVAVIAQTPTPAVQEAPVSGTADFLSKLDAHVAYISSFKDSSKSGLGLVANYPVLDVQMPKFLGSKKLVFSADAIGFVDSGMAGGFGGSVMIQKLLSGINAGVGYAPKGYGWSWYMGVAKLY